MKNLKLWLIKNDIKFKEGKTINKTPLYYIFHRGEKEKKLIRKKLKSYTDLEVRELKINYYNIKFMVYHKEWENM